MTGGAMYAPQEGWAAILVDEDLTRQERAAALAHELVHDEWGGSCSHESLPETWRAVVCRHENYIDREVARRMVPAEELGALCERRASLELPTSAREVAEHFDVPEDVAARALLAFCSSPS